MRSPSARPLFIIVLAFGMAGARAQSDNPCPAPPMLPVNTSCVNTTGTNAAGFTQSGTTPLPSCGNFGTVRDAWYRFTAPPSGIVNIQMLAGGMTDAAVAVYSAPACTGPFVQVGCDDDSGPGLMPQLLLGALVPGQVYYIRIWRALLGANGTFQICLTTPALPVADCYYILSMFDSFGDGWNGSTVGISINGGPFTNYTVTAAFNYAVIPVTGTAILVVQFTNTSPFPAEMSYMIQLGGGVLFASGSPPATGTVFTYTLDCQPLPAAPQDCLGGATICNGQSFNNNSNNTGATEDLGPSNQGCLASGEQQGTWYYFSPSASGTIGFTITPVVTTDYDFAVWGPMAAVTCPPPGPPLRCSYSALQVPTGCGNGAGDVTEGAGGNAWVSTFNVIAGQIYILYVDNFTTNGQAFGLSWQLTNGASLDCTVLPIELLAFDARPNGAVIELSWSTATELDNDRFEIERSADGIEFTTIGSIDGAGTSHERTDYLSHDPSPVVGMNYYRLKQVDLDGHFERSGIVPVMYRPVADALLLFPNPGIGTIGVMLQEDVHQAAVEILDATGRVVLTHPLMDERTEISASALAIGMYTVQVVDRDGRMLAQGHWIKQ